MALNELYALSRLAQPTELPFKIKGLFQASVETDELAPPTQVDAGPEMILRADG